MSEVTERDIHTEQLEVRTSAYEFRISEGQYSTHNRDVSPGDWKQGLSRRWAEQ